MLTAHQDTALEYLTHCFKNNKFVLIGAGALAVQMSMGWHYTEDLDLVVVAELAEIDSVLNSPEWEKNSYIAHRWCHKNGSVFDIIPVTPSAQKGGAIFIRLSMLEFLRKTMKSQKEGSMILH